jgi:lysophospholipase L1-like esterase
MHQHSFSARPGNRPISLAILGDSLACGLGASKCDAGMTQRLYQRLRAERPGSSFSNYGVPHSTMGDVLRHQVPQLRGKKADVVLLIAGANDLRYTLDTIVFARRFRALLDAVHAAAPHAIVVVGGMPDVTQTAGVPWLLKAPVMRMCRRMNSMMRSIVAERGDHFIDMFAFTNAPLSGCAGSLLCEDGYHPNDDGYAEIAERAYPAFAAALQNY